MYKDIMMLIAPTNRSKAYLQSMVNNGMFPSKVLIMTEDSPKLLDEENRNEEGSGIYFNEKIPIMHTILSNHIKYEFINTDDINSECIKDRLKECEESYVVYSGYGGAILKQHLFELGKKFIHIHAGALPEYRGSTTAYYSMLDKGIITATAIFMNARLDDGDIICSLDFELPPKGVDIDYIYEPYTRAQVLVKALQDYEKNGRFITTSQNKEKAETYYIIHPVLKHVALLGRLRS